MKAQIKWDGVYNMDETGYLIIKAPKLSAG